MSKGSSGLVAALCAVVAAAALAGTACAATAERAEWGALADGTAIEAITLANARGVRARIISYGATLQSLESPDRHGHSADVVLGYDSLDGYVQHPSYFGVTVGRYANRIAGGRFTLDGKSYQLTLNDKSNSLHGGTRGFDKQAWRVLETRSGALASVTLALDSPDGDQGYPGNLHATVTYSLDAAGELGIEFRATSDAPTVVNMTNHALFNLAGEGAARDVLGERLTIPAARYTPVDATLIPTGELRAVADTVFDFRAGRVLGDAVRDGRDPQIVAGRGYDHNYALDAGLTAEPKLAARLLDAVSGRMLEVWSTEPGLQIYTGNFLDGTLKGKQGHLYRMGDGLALEPQKFPDTPNQPAFGSARVDAAHPYHHRMAYRLSTLMPSK
jgi:aldose 1-epimerase